MSVTHAPWIVALSILVAIQGAYVALGLALDIGERAGWARRLTLGASAFTLGVAIWSMHFIGMLAMRQTLPLRYLMLPTLLSLLLAVFVVGVATFIASLARDWEWSLPLAACVMGIGIATMHYTGMSALRGSIVMQHGAGHVIASFAVGIGASNVGLRLAFRAPRALRQRDVALAGAAILLGLAISGVHYVAMAGLILLGPQAIGGALETSGGLALSSDLLALLVAVVAFGVSAVFFLTIVPDRVGARTPASPPAAASQLPVAPPPVRPAVTVGPLGGAGGPRLRQFAATLPTERQGTTTLLPVESIVFVQADSHYTILFDGHNRHFCPLAIGAVEQRLDPARFLRVHRSYLVACDRITSLQRAGDGGLIRLATDESIGVPVSRARYAHLKQRLATGGVAGEIGQPG